MNGAGRLGFALLLSCLVCAPVPSRSEPVDAAALFDEKCARCHKDAGSLARAKLSIEQNELVGKRSGKSVAEKLPRHFGKLSDEEIDLIVSLLRQHIEGGDVEAGS